jgi:hypothetical protein
MQVVLPMDIVSIQGDGYHLFIKIKIGRKAFRMLVDTGASRTVFDSTDIALKLPHIELSNADQLSVGLGSSGIAGKIAMMGNLSFKGLKINKYTTMLLDLSHVNDSYKGLGLEPIDGVLGSDLMHELAAIINFYDSTITLSKQK